MPYAGVYNDLTKALTYLTVILSIASCKGDKQSTFYEMASMHPAPQIVALNIQEGYSINPLTGDSIKPIINSLGDTVTTGVPVPARGKFIDPNSVAKPRVIPAGKPKVVPTHQNVHQIPENLTIIPVNKDSLKTFTLGIDTSSFVLINSTGDTVPTGVPIPARVKVVPCRQPPPVKALLPRMKANASINIKYLDVEQGMISSLVTSILEDSRGNLWFGTWDGVSIYNGESFTHFTEKEGLSNNTVWSILEDSHGNIWVATGGGGVSKYNGETFTHFTEKEGLSHNSVNSILEDSHGNLWFGTGGGGVSKYNGETFTHFTQKEGLGSNWVFSILEDSYGNLWFGTGLGKVTRYDGNTFTHLTQKEGLSKNNVSSILEDSHGNLWFGTYGGGVCKYTGETITHFTEKEGLSDNAVISILEDSHGNLWFGTQYGGVSMFDGETFTHITENEGLGSNWVFSILEDSHDNLWFATDGGGVSIYNGQSLRHFTRKEGLSHKWVMSMLEDSHGNLWFGTYGGGVSKYNGQTFTHFTEKEGLNHNVVMSILEDSHGNIWCGTRGGGVNKYNGKSFSHYTTEEGLYHDMIMSILEDSHGNFWFASWLGGLSMYNGQTFTHFTDEDGLSHNTVWSILEDSQGNLWFGTLRGGVSMYDGETFTHFTQKEGLSSNRIRSILEDSRGNLWFGTRDRGVSMYDGETFTHLTKKEGLSHNWVRSILEDSHGNLWLGTYNGLNCLAFGPDTVSSSKDSSFACIPKIYTYGLQDGLKGVDFLLNSGLVDSRNRIWWGSGKSLTMLDMNNFKIPDEPPAIQLNQININGQFTDYRHMSDSAGTKMEFNGVARFYNYPLNLELPYIHNHLTFHFSAIDWSAPHKIRYSYKMEGLDDKWSAPAADPKAEYRNLPYGRYTFKVRAIGAAQMWSETFEYTFRILPPFWLTWWAYMIYTFILLLLVSWYRGFLIKREKVNADLRVKEVEVNKMQELDHMKSRFFANISHEFRTPLTLIQGPIEDMNRDLPDLPVEKSRELLQFMKRNTVRLQNLINQILDISKLETGKVKLQASEGNFEQFVKTIILSFLSLAESKKIEYVYDMPDTSDIVFFDNDKLEKILTNLISNAFKFTAEGGKIRVGLKYITSSTNEIPMYAILEVADTGRGIPRDRLDQVFDRFYQVRDTDSRDAEGTGLGLALTKELVDLYRGEISVDSKEGKGSTFTLKLPVSKNSFTEEERVTRSVSQDLKPEPSEPIHDQKESECTDVEGDLVQKTADERPVILIVEDNVDLSNYISQNLESNYHIMTAINGKTGLDIAVECIPDLIISDVMMPEMDGMEMSTELKTNERTNHIPVIMLTAKADRDSKLEGLETGADDYMIKPFDTKELQVRVNNLIQQRRKLRDRYRKEFLTDFKSHEIPAPEDDFMVRVLDCVKKHMTESEFNVEQLGIELGFSRTQLYRKIIALTDYTPTEFIRNNRLKMAAKMFHEGHRNITRVLYSVGFNSPAYFTQCFREVYGINPSEYIKKKELTG